MERLEGEVLVREAGDKKIAYTESFKELVSAHPRLLAGFREAEKIIKEKAGRDESLHGFSVMTEDGYKIEPALTSDTGYEPGNSGTYLKVQVEKQVLFVKTVPGYFDDSRGVEEILSSQKAKELLCDIQNVEVVDFKFGYQDKERTYFVSKWEDGVLLNEYLSILEVRDPDISDAERIRKSENLKNRLKQIRERLHNFLEVEAHNILYDERNDKLIVFDLFESS